MSKILTLGQAEKVAQQLKSKGRVVVLAGGCFDLLHLGHILFLERAKERGDVLMVLLESDENVRRIKGENRPINNQNDRARVLAAFSAVDYVIPLPQKFDNKIYDQVVLKINPDILATTKGDPQRHHKERQAKLTRAKVIDIIEPLKSQSTTRLAELLKEEYGL